MALHLGMYFLWKHASWCCTSLWPRWLGSPEVGHTCHQASISLCGPCHDLPSIRSLSCQLHLTHVAGVFCGWSQQTKGEGQGIDPGQVVRPWQYTLSIHSHTPTYCRGNLEASINLKTHFRLYEKTPSSPSSQPHLRPISSVCGVMTHNPSTEPPHSVLLSQLSRPEAKENNSVP